jgi:HSP20 family protein
MAAWQPVFVTADLGDFADDLRRVFQELDGATPARRQMPVGQCNPPIDVLETDETVEIAIDLPGVPAAQVRVVLRGGVVLVAGEKQTEAPATAGDYHLVERTSGRFARAVRVAAAFDGSKTRAALQGGELRVVLPKIHERRGRPRPVPVQGDPGA